MVQNLLICEKINMSCVIMHFEPGEMTMQFYLLPVTGFHNSVTFDWKIFCSCFALMHILGARRKGSVFCITRIINERPQE